MAQTSTERSAKHHAKEKADAKEEAWEAHAATLTGIEDPVDWAKEHYHQEKDMPWLPYSYLATLMRVAHRKDGPRTIALWKASQLGFTQMTCALHAYLVGERDKKVVVAMPKDERADEYYKRFISPMYTNVNVLSALQGAHDYNSVSGKVKVFSTGAESSTQGAGVSDRYSSFTADLMVLDELDRYPILGEGDAVFLSQRAVRNRRGVVLCGSTPTTEHGPSQIENAYKNRDIAFVFAVSCPECSEFVPLEWEQMRFDKKGTRAKRAASAKYICQICKQSWTYEKLEPALNCGRWVEASYDDADNWPQPVEGGAYIEEDGTLRTAGGKKKDWPRSAGFAIWAAYSVWYPWPDMIDRWLEAQHDSQKLRVVCENDLARPFSDAQTEVSQSAILQHAYDDTVPMKPAEKRKFRAAYKHHSLGVIGVDVQQDFVSVLVTLWGPEYRCVVVDRQEFVGETDRYGGAAWRHFNGWLRKNPRYEKCEPYLMAVDTSFRQVETILNLNSTPFRGHVYAVQGRAGSWPSHKPGTANVKGRGYRIYTLGVDDLKRTVVAGLNSGRMQVDVSLAERLKGELTAERLVTEMRKGREYDYWKQNAGQQNEAFDCLVYSLAAMKIANVQEHPPRTRGVCLARAEDAQMHLGAVV